MPQRLKPEVIAGPAARPKRRKKRRLCQEPTAGTEAAKRGCIFRDRNGRIKIAPFPIPLKPEFFGGLGSPVLPVCAPCLLAPGGVNRRLLRVSLFEPGFGQIRPCNARKPLACARGFLWGRDSGEAPFCPKLMRFTITISVAVAGPRWPSASRNCWRVVPDRSSTS
jgi:hypothetical protein